jgi:hypothetical protein
MRAEPNCPTLGKTAVGKYLFINIYLIVNIKCLTKAK